MMLLVTVAFCSCLRERDKIKSFIPGTYVSSTKGEYSQVRDTLVIAALDTQTFSVRRKIAIQSFQDGQAMPWEHQTSDWTAVYNDQNHTLEENRHSGQISFLPDKNQLLVEQSVYAKIAGQ